MAMIFFLSWQVTPTAAEEINPNTKGAPEEFGANAFDEEDDTEAIQKALDTYGTVELKDGGIYYISDTLHIRSSQTIYTPSIPATIVQTINLPAMTNTYKMRATVKINEWLKKGQTNVSLADVYPADDLNIQTNDFILLRSNKLWKEDNRGYLKKGEIHTAQALADQTLVLSEGIYDAYSYTENLTVNVYEPMTVRIENINFTRPSSGLHTNAMITLWYTQNSVLNNLTISNARDSGIILQYNYRTTVDNCNFNLGVTNDVSQTGYGIQDNGGAYSHISNCTFNTVRRGVDLSGNIPNWNSLVENCYAFGPSKGSTLSSGNSGFGTHSTAVNATFRNNFIKGFNQAFAIRGTNILIENNTVEGNQNYFMQATHGTNITVTGNTYARFSQRTKLPIFANLTQSFKGTIKITKNTTTPVAKWTSKKNHTKTSGNKVLK